MELIFLGTGTSQGVPMIACDCPVCTSTDERNHRSRTSVHVELGGWHVQVDAAQEFRLQCLRSRIRRVDTFVLTHSHADHLLGMDDLRRFCDERGGAAVPVYATMAGLERVRTIYPYADGLRPQHAGYPAFDLREMPARLETPGGVIESTLLPHGPMEVLGLVFTEHGTGRRLAYYTDCKLVPPAALALARGVDVLVLDGLRPHPHPAHLSIPEAVTVAQALGAPRSYLTHLTHAVDHAEWSARLPPGIALAHDGLRVTV